VPELDTYAAAVEWNRRTVLAAGLPPGCHVIVVSPAGTKNPASSNVFVQIVDIEAERGG
jgi:hypothetical protein